MYNFFKRFIWHIDETLTGITIPDQSEFEKNGNEEVLQTPRVSAGSNLSVK